MIDKHESDEVKKVIDLYAETYLKNRFKDQNQLLELNRQKEFFGVAAIAHKVKGNASTFGFPSLQSIAIQIESAAKDEDDAKINALIAEFGSELNKLEQQLEHKKH